MTLNSSHSKRYISFCKFTALKVFSSSVVSGAPRVQIHVFMGNIAHPDCHIVHTVMLLDLEPPMRESRTNVLEINLLIKEWESYNSR